MIKSNIIEIIKSNKKQKTKKLKTGFKDQNNKDIYVGDKLINKRDEITTVMLVNIGKDHNTDFPHITHELKDRDWNNWRKI